MGYYAGERPARCWSTASPRTIRSPRDATALGIGMVYQRFTLVDNMTVAENLVLALPPTSFIFDWAAETKAVADFMARMPFKLSIRARCACWPPARSRSSRS